MDTISRENNSMLPVGGIVVGVLGLLLGVFALVQATKANNAVKEHQTKIDKIEGIETQVGSLATSVDKTSNYAKSVYKEVENALANQVAPRLGSLESAVAKLEAAATKPVATNNSKKGGEPAVAGPNEYIVKSGDSSGAKIARDHGIPLPDLMAVNPSVNWSKLKPGDRLKMPAKK
ncbi:MAG: LysM domain-containing protein [Opitutaceae bacterium]